MGEQDAASSRDSRDSKMAGRRARSESQGRRDPDDQPDDGTSKNDALKLKGLQLAASGEFEDAIKYFSATLEFASGTQEESELLSCRSAAFSGLSERLRVIPAEHSESHALFGLDPFALAQLARKDAQRARALQPRCAAGCLQEARAHFLLEAYSAAEEAVAAGLAIAPLDAGLHAQHRAIQAALAEQPLSPVVAATPAKRARCADRCEDAECILCMKLLFEPVTTPCGHTFCRACLARAADHSNKCPMCRTVLHVGREVPITVALAALLERSFPAEYAARRAEHATLAAGLGADAQCGPPLPLFVMSCMLPGERMALNIFEPRYRLMVRRCMEGSRRFGMATLGRGRDLHPVACECEILDCQPQPDGRFYLEVVGRRRFWVEAPGEQDGYRLARPRYFRDAPVSAGSPEGVELAALARQVEALADGWVDQVKTAATGRHRRHVLELLHRAGEKPAAAQPEELSFWVANVMPMSAADRVAVLGLESTAERLRWLKDQPHRLDLAHTCAIM